MMVENVVVDVEDNKNQEVAWSMDQAQLFSISSEMDLADRHYSSKQYVKCFIELENVKHRIISNLSVDERELLSNIENRFNLNIFACSLSERNDKGEYLFVDRLRNKPRLLNFCNSVVCSRGKDLKTTLNLYRVTLMDLLGKYGYLAKMKKDSTLMNT